MVIAVEYKNGRIKEFDANAFTSSDAMKRTDRQAANALTEFDLRLDNLATDGLRLNIFWHDVSKPAGNVRLTDTLDENNEFVEMPQARRRLGVSITLVNTRVLEQVSRIIVYRANGAVQAAWRQGSGDWLIVGSMFEAQRVLTYSDANTTSINQQALNVFRYLKRANPLMDEDEIAGLMGYPIDAYRAVERNEMAQLEDDGMGGGEAAGGAPGEAAAGDGGEPGFLGSAEYADIIERFAGGSGEGAPQPGNRMTVGDDSAYEDEDDDA